MGELSINQYFILKRALLTFVYAVMQKGFNSKIDWQNRTKKMPFLLIAEQFFRKNN